MNKLPGLAVTVIIGILLMFYFFETPIKSPGQTFFATGGDGLKDYYTTSYYIKYDTSYTHSMVMNYPHGEHIMFTGSQPSHSMLLKLVNDYITDIGDYTVGVMNIAMLISVVAGMVFICLLLIHFRLNYLYSALVSAGIAFLSPQLARMGGHFSLSYVFVIPAILYLIAIFHHRAAVWKSILLGVFMLWAIGVHVYMLGFYSFIVVSYWIYIFASQRTDLTTSKCILHFSLQFLLPLILFLLFSVITDTVADRTAYPWGFLYYKAYPESVLLPIDMPYGAFLSRFSDFSHIDWEGRAFVGMAAATGFLIMLVLFFVRLIKKQYIPAFKPAGDNLILNIFFWTSVLALLYSFGIPFIFGLEGLVEYIGPLRQMRGIARFSWLFFYVINIYVFWKIWHLKEYLHRYLWMVLVVAAIGALWTDAFYNADYWSRRVNNELPESRWACDLKTGEFQAILPIPYYHVGSENIWIEPRGGIDMYASIVSWKTGLPSMGVLLSRTSLSQTIGNCELIWEAYRKPAVLELMDRGKDILIVALNDEPIPPPQKQLLELSEKLRDEGRFSLLRLNPDTLDSYYEKLYKKEYSAFGEKELFMHNGYYYGSAIPDFSVLDFPDYGQDIFYITPGSKTMSFGSREYFIDQPIPATEPEREYVLSFWIEGVHTDLFLRSQMIIELKDKYGSVYDYTLTDLFRHVVTTDGNWALIEKTIHVQNPGDRIQCLLRNSLLKNKSFTFDHVIIRAADTDVYKEGRGWLMRNNRFFIR